MLRANETRIGQKWKEDKRKYILLVQAEGKDIESILEALRRQNVMNEIIIASDPKDAVDFLNSSGKWVGRGQGPLPSFILINTDPPTTLAIVRDVRKLSVARNVPIVALRNWDATLNMAELGQKGLTSLIARPEDNEELEETLLVTSLYWLLINQSQA